MMNSQELDNLVFRLEKLFLTAEAYDTTIHSTDFSLPFYALIDEIREVEKAYRELSTPLQDLV